MASKLLLILMTALLADVALAPIVLNLAPAIQFFQTFCSSFCRPAYCIAHGFTSNNCTACNAALGWSLAGSSCTVSATGYQLVGSSGDAGGSIVFSPADLPSSCSTLASYLTYTPYGDFFATSTVTVTLPGGTNIPHYTLFFIFSVILVDTDSSTASQTWIASNKMTVTVNNAPPASVMFGLGTPQSSYAGYCGNPARKDSQSQLAGSFPHNETNTAIIFTITTTNLNSQATWVAKEFLLEVRKCNIACLSCYGSAANQCYSCDGANGFMLSGTTCSIACLVGYGQTGDPAVCVLCSLACTACNNTQDSCSACQTTGSLRYYLYYNNVLGYNNCVNTCPSGLTAYFSNNITSACELCDSICESCSINSSYCYNCTAGYSWMDYYCYNPCPNTYYSTNSGRNCSTCNLTCSVCSGFSTTCLACTLTGPNTAYLLGTTCYINCPAGKYKDNNAGIGPNFCLACDNSCATCIGNPTPCQSCNSNYFLYNNACVSHCPVGYIQYAATNICLDCILSCVDLTINMHFPDALCESLYIDMNFTLPLDFATFDMANFQIVSFSGADNFVCSTTYTQLNGSAYRITLQPTGYAFLYNRTITVTTKTLPTSIDKAADLTPFKTSLYSKSKSIEWFLLKSPSMGEGEKRVINGLGALNNFFAGVTTAPVIAEIKKAGLFSLIFSGTQITTTSVFVNSVPAQNMYQAVRFWGMFVLHDVPEWERNSKIPNNVVGKDTASLAKDHRLLQGHQRLLFDITTTPWRYQRTGHSTFFLYDAYIPMMLICILWLIGLIVYVGRRWHNAAFVKAEGCFFSFMYKMHEGVIIYLTTATVLEWMHFDAASGQRWVSLFASFTMTFYFMGYKLFILYDLTKYPEAFIGNAQYERFLTRYGRLLRHIRFQKYDIEEWSPRHLFRPYNYHILSIFKKVCMIASLPLFYKMEHWQPVVLIILQFLQLVRLAVTRPFSAKWRNIIYFIMELALLLFFLFVLINTFIINEITGSVISGIGQSVQTYFGIGWAGFSMVFLYNIGHLVLFFIDVVLSYRYTDRQLMELARWAYYQEVQPNIDTEVISGSHRMEVEVPMQLVGLIIGRGGETIKGINHRTGAFVRVTNEDCPKCGRKVSIITGSKELCLIAKYEVEELIQKGLAIIEEAGELTQDEQRMVKPLVPLPLQLEALKMLVPTKVQTLAVESTQELLNHTLEEVAVQQVFNLQLRTQYLQVAEVKTSKKLPRKRRKHHHLL